MNINELVQIVGKDAYFDDAAVLEEYSSDISFVHNVRPRCIVRPKAFEDVQAIVKWANETKTTLVPISSGAPHFRGDTVPSTGGAVIVDLIGMNKIVRIDRRNRVAMVEPGVTFEELIPALKEQGLRMNMPMLPRKTKSVIGSMLEREPVMMPTYQWDALDPLTCIEVIFGEGRMFRTGSAAGPGTLEEQWEAGRAQVNPMGPGQTDFARVVQGAQGTMGIVTWATLRCEELPTIEKPFLAGDDSLDKLTDFASKLQWLKIVDICLLLNNTTLAAILSDDSKEYERLKDKLPRWILFYTLAGFKYFPEERLEFQQELMLRAGQEFGVKPLSAVAGISADSLAKTLYSPSEEPYWKLRHKGSCQDIFFVTTMNRVQGFKDIMFSIAEQCGYPAHDIGLYIQPMVQGTSCHCEFSLFYDPNNAREKKKVLEIYQRGSEALIQAGAFFNRPYGAWAEMAYRRDGGTASNLKKVKSIFDPNNIMNTGKLCF